MGHPIRSLHVTRDDVEHHPARREFIILGGRPVASTNVDRASVSETTSVSATGFSSMELLAAVAGPQLSSVIVLRRGVDGLAFVVERGKVVDAFGTGPRGSMPAWSKAARALEMEGSRADRAGGRVGLVKMFIERCVLEHLWLVSEPGAELSILRGDARWIGSTLEGEHAPSLQHLLMTFAQEGDDCARLLPKLSPLSRYVFPASQPQAQRLRVVAEEQEEGESDLGSVARGEMDEGEVLHQIWRLCNGQSTVEALLERSVFGRARTLRALDRLRRDGCIELCPQPSDPEPEQPPEVPRGVVDLARLRALYSERAEREDAIESFIGDVPLWLIELEAMVEAQDREGCLKACGSLIDAADAVAAGPFLDVVMAVTRLGHAEAWTRMESALGRVSAAFSKTFRALLDQHAR